MIDFDARKIQVELYKTRTERDEARENLRKWIHDSTDAIIDYKNEIKILRQLLADFKVDKATIDEQIRMRKQDDREDAIQELEQQIQELEQCISTQNMDLRRWANRFEWVCVDGKVYCPCCGISWLESYPRSERGHRSSCALILQIEELDNA